MINNYASIFYHLILLYVFKDPGLKDIIINGNDYKTDAFFFKR